jgi:hypothetical protein
VLSPVIRCEFKHTDCSCQLGGFRFAGPIPIGTLTLRAYKRQGVTSRYPLM